MIPRDEIELLERSEATRDWWRLTGDAYSRAMLTRTRLAGRGRWLDVGEETLVPTTAVRVLHRETMQAIIREQEGADRGVRP